MAYVPGGSLRDRLRDGGRLPDPAALARELLGALGHVHAAGIVHRDVKPGNILLDEQERSHLTDFGIARPQDATTMTQTGIVLGTMRYLAPEVAEGEPATERSDLYAAGGVIREVAGEDPEPAVAGLIDALAAQDPEDRPSSADDALALLDEQAATRRMAPLRKESERPGTPATATTRERPAATADEARERASGAVRRVDDVIRRPWFLPAAAFAAVVLLAVIVIALAGGGEAPQGGAASPAPASAPLDEQLRGLDRAIDAAASR
jgi:eukaryotic-like serine/threonine-protein kinase